MTIQTRSPNSLSFGASRGDYVPICPPDAEKMADSYHNLPVAKACSNCARAKAKCDGVASTGKCSR